MNKIKRIYNIFKKTLSEDEVQFRLVTTLKLILIPVITIIFLVLNLSIVLRLDFAFFEANRLHEIYQVRETFYNYLGRSALELLPYFGLFLIVLTFLGLYISKMLLRPFKIIGSYCENRIIGKQVGYDPGFFSELKLLTRFCEFFFTTVEQSEKSGELTPKNIPNRFTRIHKPIFEYSFFIQNLSYIFITSVCVGIGVHILAVNLHDDLLELSSSVLRQSKIIQYEFFESHGEIWTDITLMITSIHFLLNIALAVHLYRMVAIPAFSIFATFRSFLKGNYKARVHLIGHYYIREQSRKINKYLDMVEKNLVKKK